MMSIRPPNVKDHWEDNDVLTQADLIAYYQIRDYESQEERIAMAKMLAGG